MGENNGKPTAESKAQTQSSSEKEPRSIGDEVEEYLKHIDALAFNLQFLGVMAATHHHVTVETYDAFLATHGEQNPDEPNEYSLKVECLAEHERLERLTTNAEIGQMVLPRSFLVALVSQYDFFLSRLIRQLFLLRPEKLSSLEKPLTFAQLLKFGNVEDAKEFVLEKEIETVLRQSHADQFEWLKTKFGLTTLTDGLDIWPEFIEITERRNLFVHCSGIVSTQYRVVCDNHKVKDIASVGVEMHVDPDYFDRAHVVFTEIAVKLAHVLWRKAAPEQRDEADDSFNGVLFELIKQENYELAVKLGQFWIATLQRKESTSRVNRLITLNLAQAYKWWGKNEEAKSVISAADWSATGDTYQLALAVLEDDFDRSAGLMKRIGKDDYVGEGAYLHWPIFKEFRKSEEFQKMFQVVFEHPFVTVQKTPLARPKSSKPLPGSSQGEASNIEYVI